MKRILFCLVAAFLLSSTLPAQSPEAAATPAGVTSAQSPEIQEFQKLEDNWSLAVNQRDQYALFHPSSSMSRPAARSPPVISN
jgi:hypothetical protein